LLWCTFVNAKQARLTIFAVGRRSFGQRLLWYAFIWQTNYKPKLTSSLSWPQAYDSKDFDLCKVYSNIYVFIYLGTAEYCPISVMYTHQNQSHLPTFYRMRTKFSHRHCLVRWQSGVGDSPTILTANFGLLFGPVGTFSILRSVSIPSMTLPNTTCFWSRKSHWAVVMKN
jgi:hypothetical protein